MTTEEFTIVPILENFEHDKVIGEVKILTAKLPTFWKFQLSVGVKILDEAGNYELVCFSPIADTYSTPHITP